MLDRRRLDALADTLFATDARGRLVGRAPRLHIIRTADAVICRCHADLDDEVAEALSALAARPRGRPAQWSHDYADYLQTLARAGPPKAIRAGPLYGFPDRPMQAHGAVPIGPANADLLLGGLNEWRPDVAAGWPMRAVVVDGRAVSICASVNASAAAHCAGVETVAEHRGRGYAARAVESWAGSVRAGGAEPFYGTTFDNLASQGVARRLGLILIGSEFSIEC